MAKMKVHELAKELDRKSKELIDFLQAKGYEVKVAQSSIEDDAIALVRKEFSSSGDKAAKAVGEEKQSIAEEKPRSEGEDRTGSRGREGSAREIRARKARSGERKERWQGRSAQEKTDHLREQSSQLQDGRQTVSGQWKRTGRPKQPEQGRQPADVERRASCTAPEYAP